jgi:hypothetical protein
MGGVGSGTREHAARFERYVRELREAKQAAEGWWAGLIKAEVARIGDEHQAELNVNTRRRRGPVINPHVIHTIRAAWLDCQAINEHSAETLRVAPQAFVLSWLEETGHRELAEFVAGLPFWPMGLDDSGKWV